MARYYHCVIYAVIFSHNSDSPPKALDCGEHHRFAMVLGRSAKIKDPFPHVSLQTKAAIHAAVQSGVRRAMIFRRRLWTAVSITALRWFCDVLQRSRILFPKSSRKPKLRFPQQ
jgi:hypothetical protein